VPDSSDAPHVGPLPLEEATALVRAELGEGLPRGEPTILRFEARLTSTGWRFSTGDQLERPGARPKGLVRRRGWQFMFDLEEDARLGYIEKHGYPPESNLELFPSLLVVNVYDDDRQVQITR
jgi:hypothetical protein